MQQSRCKVLDGVQLMADKDGWMGRSGVQATYMATVTSKLNHSEQSHSVNQSSSTAYMKMHTSYMERMCVWEGQQKLQYNRYTTVAAVG